MRAGQNLFFEKEPLLENKKSITFFFKDLIIFEYNKGMKEHIFPKIFLFFLFFAPWIFVKLWTFNPNQLCIKSFCKCYV